MNTAKSKRTKHANKSRPKPVGPVEGVELPEQLVDAIESQRGVLLTALNELFGALLMLRRIRADETEVDADMDEVWKWTSPNELVEMGLVRINKVNSALDYIARGLVPKKAGKGVSA
jgi:hypothetical protein